MNVCLFSESLETQMKTARSRVDDSLVRNNNELVKLYDAAYAATTCYLYGDFARGFTWAENYGAADEGDAPRGFQFNVSPRAPVFARPFSEHDMFNGTICYPLSAGAGSSLSIKTRKPISYEHFCNHAGDVGRKLEALFKDGKNIGGDDRRSANSNFAGIFWDPTTESFYCIVQAHNENIAQATSALIAEHEPMSFECVHEYAAALVAEHNAYHSARSASGGAKRASDQLAQLQELAASADDEFARKQKKASNSPYKSWSELFFHDEKMRALSREQDKHRAAVVCQTLAASGVGPVTVNGTLSDMVDHVLECASASSNQFNCVDRVNAADAHSDVVYLSNLYSALSVTRSGALLRTSATNDISLVIGKPSIRVAQLTQTGLSIGIPIGTGPKFHPSLLRRGVGAEFQPVSQSAHSFWPGDPDSTSLFLSKANWRENSPAMTKAWGETRPDIISVRPVRVFHSASD